MAEELAIRPGDVVTITHFRGPYRVEFVHTDRVSVLGPVTDKGAPTTASRRRSVPIGRVRP